MTLRSPAISLASFLKQRFPENTVMSDHVVGLLDDYERSGLAPPHMLEEVTSGEEGKLWAHIWEAMLYRHLSERGFEFRESRVRKSGQLGPDFGILRSGHTVWIEAVVPAPAGILAEWLEPPRIGEFRPRSMPHEAMLLRWTSAIKDKRDKIATYIERGIVLSGDAVAIAVNSCRLADFVADDHGISQLPFAVEAVFPIGHLGIPITRDGRPDGEAQRMPRYSVRKATGAEVPTYAFLDPAFSMIGAIIGSNRREMAAGGLRLTVVHNPLATCPLEREAWGAEKEFVAEPAGDHYILRQL